MRNKKSPPLLESVRITCLRRGYSEPTENSYRYWGKRYILCHQRQHPSKLGKRKFESFLDNRVVEDFSSASQSVALHAILFMYRFVLDAPIDSLKFTRGGKRYHQVPIVLSKEEVATLLRRLTGDQRLMLYGTGMRLNGCLSLRVQDVDLACYVVRASQGKGRKEHLVPLLKSLIAELASYLDTQKARHFEDCKNHGVGVYIPNRLPMRYPSATKE